MFFVITNRNFDCMLNTDIKKSGLDTDIKMSGLDTDIKKSGLDTDWYKEEWA